MTIIDDNVRRHVFIYRKGWLKQKWYAKFIGENNRTLAHTEFYTSRAALTSMLEKYYPNWTIMFARKIGQKP